MRCDRHSAPFTPLLRLARSCLCSAVATAAICAWTQESDTPQSTPVQAGESVAVELAYQETTFPVHHLGVSVLPTNQPFAREPASMSPNVSRGRFNIIHSRRAGTPVPFIWDRDKREGRLHLDLNQNGDLTDDTNSPFAASDRHTDRHAAFEGIHLSLTGDTNLPPDLFSITLYNYGRLYATLAAKSFYSGRARLGGQDYQVAVVPWDRSHLLVRPWDQRTQPFGVASPVAPVVSLPKMLWLKDKTYKVTYTAPAHNASGKIEFEPTTVALGELKIEGKYIRQLKLWSEDQAVLADSPSGVLKIPAAQYNSAEVVLQSGELQAHVTRDYRNSAPTPAIAVTEGEAAILSLGGPLTNLVSIRRTSGSLELEYVLKGGGGASYTLAGSRRQPSFKAYAGGKEIASGKFEFG